LNWIWSDFVYDDDDMNELRPLVEYATCCKIEARGVRDVYFFCLLSCEDWDKKTWIEIWDCVERNHEYSKERKQMEKYKAAGLISTRFFYISF